MLLNFHTRISFLVALSTETMSVSKRDVWKLYRALLKHSRRHAEAQTRESLVSDVVKEFGRFKTATDPQVVKRAYYNGLTRLHDIKTHATISRMFAALPDKSNRS